MTTFDLTGTVDVEPVGTALFHDLVDYCLSLGAHTGEEGHHDYPGPVQADWQTVHRHGR